MFKKILIVVMLLGVVGAAYLYLKRSQSGGFELEEGYSYLYDGASLQGWRVIGGESMFSAQGDDIVGRHGPGANTFLRTEKTYSDFSLKMQMRWDELGNSGVLFRSNQRDGDGRAYGYQFELDHSERAWSGGIYDEARRGWLANLEADEEARKAIRLDDWNDIEIEARGASLKTWINGVPAADIVDGLDSEGFIALQVHSGNAGVMRWRRIRIKELPPMAQPGESLDSAKEWRTEGVSDLTFDSNGMSGLVQAEDHWLIPRRRFSDAQVNIRVAACDQPTIIQMRYSRGEGLDGESFAEVSIFADRAQARLVTAAGEVVMDEVSLEEADQHRFTGVSFGGAVTLTVDESDALRVIDSGLADRGQLRIQPARCGDSFQFSELAWSSLKENRDQVQFYQTLDTEPAPVLTPQQAIEAFKIAPGYEVELVAAEPLVEDPVAMAWDEYGRLYVVEMRGYMPDAYGTGSDEPVGQVVRLEDTDGDGRMDTSEIFLGKLVNPRAVAVVNEGILIGEPPNLWLCELPGRGALCENKRSVGHYGADVETANVEHIENRLLPGLDNWLYNSKSTRSLRLVDGKLQEREGLFRGQWGMTKDDYGRLLYNHNSTWLQADLFAAEDLVLPGAKDSVAGLGVNLTNPAEVFSVRVNPGVNRAYLKGTLREDGRLNQATGVSGLVAYRGDQFPEEHRGDVFVPESAGNVVAQFGLSESGMELSASQRLYPDETWGQRDFLGSTDERFRPVDAMNGPDGALYIIDMYRGIIQDDHFLTDELREQIFQRELDTPIGMGRIWRIRASDGKTDRSIPPLENVADRVAALEHSNGWVRDTAQRLLLDGSGNVAAELEKIAGGDDTVSALHAIWALQGRGELSTNLVMQLAVADDPQRQVNALRAGRGMLQLAELLQLGKDLENASEAITMQLAFALGEHSAEAAIRDNLGRILAQWVSSDYVVQAVVRAVQDRELAFLSEMLATDAFNEQSVAANRALAALAGSAYRSLRGDLASTDPANPALQELLALIQSRQGDTVWQQIALLKGLESQSVREGFTPAVLPSVPPIFSDGTVSEKDPLWNARLAGRAAFTWPGDELAMGITPLSPEQLQLMSLGEAFYPQCAACHGADGGGAAGLAPALAGASWVTGPPEWLGRIILQGMSGPIEINGESWNGVMPPHGHLQALDDTTLAGLMTFLRRSWGNKADPVTVELATAIRAGSSNRAKPWTAPELEAVPYDRGYARFVGKYKVSFITMTVSEKREGLHFAVPMYGSGFMEPAGKNIFRAAAGEEEVKLQFVVDENGSVNEMLMHRKGEKIALKRKSD